MARIPLSTDPGLLADPEQFKAWVGELNRQLDELSYNATVTLGGLSSNTSSIAGSASAQRVHAGGFRFPTTTSGIALLNQWYSIMSAKVHGADRIGFTPGGGSAIMSCAAPASHTFEVRMYASPTGALWTWTNVTSASFNYEALDIANWPANYAANTQLQVRCTAGSLPTTFTLAEYQVLVWR